MIKYIKRKNLDTKKYDNCIENALNSRLYAFSWYLDIVADNWDVLVLNDYEAVMPLPWRRKYLIKYIYQPFWLLQVGVFQRVEGVGLDLFLKEVKSHFLFSELRMNTGNRFNKFNENRVESTMQVISLENSYEEIYSKYSRNRKRDCKKAKENKLQEVWGDNPSKLVNLFSDNIGDRTPQIKQKDYDTLLKLLQTCVNKGVGEMLSIYDTNSRLVSAAFFINYKERATELVCASDFDNRSNGGNTFFNDRAIYRYQTSYNLFDFGGSSMDTISSYYKSYGAKDEFYDLIKFNKFPSFLKK